MATVKACDLFFKNVYTVHENKQKPNAKKWHDMFHDMKQ